MASVLSDRGCMSAEDKQKESQGGLTWMIWAMLLPIFYMLSIGLDALVTKGTPTGRTTVRAVYAPVIWLHDHTVLKRPLEAYVDFWVGR